MLRTILLAITFAFSAAHLAFAAPPKSIDVPAGNLAAALQQLAKQADAEFVFSPGELEGARTEGVRGEFTVEGAASKLLEGTKFRLVKHSSGAFLIKAQPLISEASSADGVWDMRLAASDNTADQAQGAQDTPVGSNDASESQLEEVIVTASRREQRVQDVVGTLQAFAGEDLEKQGADGFADYLRTVPGLSLRSHSNGANKIAIRGISNVAGIDAGWTTVSTVGVYLNDVPVQGTSLPPDFALYDLQRVEVLKGPQGTLYGEGAMGGAIKMILNAPDLDETSSKADFLVSSTESGGFNYSARGAVNLPLVTDRLALRVVGTYRDDEGFVDNIARGEKNHDDKRVSSVRGVLAAEISEALSAEALVIHYQLRQEGFPEILRDGNGYQLNAPEDTFNEADATLAALTLKNDFGFAELTSVTSHLELDRNFNSEVQFGRFFFAPVTQDPYRSPAQLKNFSQEFRLVSQGDDRLDWIVGAYYHDKEQDAFNFGTIAPIDLFAVNAALAEAGQPLLGADGLYFESHVGHAYEQYAVYGEGNVDLGRGFEVTAGLRYFEETLDSVVSTTGYSLVSPFTTAALPLSKKYSSVLPKIAFSYQATDNHLLYLQAAEGFRSGARNPNAAFAGDEGADPDTLWSYELGSKNTFANGRVTFNAAAFFVDWQGVQDNVISLSPDGVMIGVLENGGDAEIYGFEAELGAAVLDAFTVGATVGYTHSELVTSAGVPGAPETPLIGEPMPSTPEWTASGYAEYVFPVAIGEIFTRFDAQYVAEQNSFVVTTANNGIPLDSYAIGSIRAGINSKNGWRLTAFVDNVWNEEGMIGSGSGNSAFDGSVFSVNPPRTIGLSISTSF